MAGTRKVTGDQGKQLDDALVRQAIDAIRALELQAEALSPGITGEDDVYPGVGMAGLALLYHILRLDCGLQDAIQHLGEHCQELDMLQSDYHKAREEPLLLTLEEFELSAANHFPPPQVAMNTLCHAIARLAQKEDAYLGEHGGIKLTSGREKQRRRTRRRRESLAKRFAEFHRQAPKEFPVSKLGFERASAALEEGGEYAQAATIEKAFLGSTYHKMLDWPKS